MQLIWALLIPCLCYGLVSINGSLAYAAPPQRTGVQEEMADSISRDSLLYTAREIMTELRYCTLITHGEDGYPHARIMDAFAPDSNFVVWMATNPRSRKVEEIKSNPYVNLFYGDAGGGSYVSLSGQAELINDMAEKQRHWKEGWEQFYPDREKELLLIKIVPVRLEVVSYRHGIISHADNWGAPYLNF